LTVSQTGAVDEDGKSGTARVPRGRYRWYQFLLAAAVSLLLAFPVAARLAADAEPARPGAIVPKLQPVAATRSGVVQSLPRFSSVAAQLTLGSADSLGAVRGDFLLLARPLVGSKRAVTLWRLVTRRGYPFLSDQAKTLSGFRLEYPFRYPQLTPILAGLPKRLSVRQAADMNDLGALLTMAAARFPIGNGIGKNAGGLAPNAAPVAYALLDLARTTGACPPQENLAFLVAADQVIRYPAAEQELSRAEHACPGDPTPLWLQGQWESQQAIVSQTAGFTENTGRLASKAYRANRPLVTFHRLELAFPRSAAGWAGEADTEMRIGYQIGGYQPFSARKRFTRALALYRRAASLQPGPDTWQGEARALAALGAVHGAAVLERRAVAGAQRPAMFRPWLIEDLERSHKFSLAADQATTLADQPLILGRGLYPDVPAAIVSSSLDPISAEDFSAPFSIGTDELTPVTLQVGPPPGGAGGIVSDLAFIPTYRPVVGLGGEKPLVS
jgi:cellulose synthase operon protein C